jgi:CubicO group peptidase (beta-lactamase class C family)
VQFSWHAILRKCGQKGFFHRQNAFYAFRLSIFLSGRNGNKPDMEKRRMNIRLFSAPSWHGTFLLLLFIASALLTGCEKDRENTSGLPVLTTLTPFNISFDSAMTGGTISEEGSSAVIERGVVWGLSPGPTVSLPTRKQAGIGSGSYQVTIKGLASATRYYLRAYATNAAGTAYGNESQFITGTNPDGAFADLRETLQLKMLEYSIPSLSVAVVRNGRLVYLDALGISDMEAGKKATVDDRYRIASLSKSLTLVAILVLAENGGLSLDQPVFGSQGILGNRYGAPPPGSLKELITVRHLLDHTSGWRNVPDDPMFSANSRTQEDIIADLVNNRSLASAPGSAFSYFNAGYCILGRVIEKITGQSYETWVTERILRPVGIGNMRLGGSTLAERLPQEVKYYQPGFDPYRMHIPRLDAAGGWIATAKDLARFLVRVDRNAGVPDIIAPNLSAEFYFDFFNWYQYGSLPGTSAIMQRINDQLGFVLLVNTRTESNPNQILDDLNAAAAARISAISLSSWPERDLF